MSQHKTLTVLEKGKMLWERRKRLGYTQRQMANKLNLDPTYLSLLENGKRTVDDWYLVRAGELLADFEKSKQGEIGTLGGGGVTRDDCRRYFERFLEKCNSHAKLGWFAVELQERFPLDKWTRKPERSVSSAPTSDEADAAALADAVGARRRKR